MLLDKLTLLVQVFFFFHLYLLCPNLTSLPSVSSLSNSLLGGGTPMLEIPWPEIKSTPEKHAVPTALLQWRQILNLLSRKRIPPIHSEHHHPDNLSMLI